MYKMNFYLKIIIIFLISLAIVIVNNYAILWLVLLLLSFVNFYYKNKKQLCLDLILVIILIFSNFFNYLYLAYKILLLINTVSTFIYFLDQYEKSFIMKTLFNKNNKSLKSDFYENNFDLVVVNIKEKVSSNYKSDVSIDDKIENDLARKYLQARIRFYGMNDSEIIVKWNKIDVMILILSLLIFIIFIILR